MPHQPACLLTSRSLEGNRAMQDYFYTLADTITALLQGDEVYTCTFRGEDSDFVRFNRSAVRQAGSAAQRSRQCSKPGVVGTWWGFMRLAASTLVLPTLSGNATGLPAIVLTATGVFIIRQIRR